MYGFDFFRVVVEAVLQGWRSGKLIIKAAIVLMIVFFVAGAALGIATDLSYVAKDVARPWLGTFLVLGLISLAVVVGYDKYIELQTLEAKIEAVEQEVRAHPDRPQLAWDLARTKLESYLDRNLSQVNSIYWLTLIVMLCGFGLVAFGISHAMLDEKKLPISIVASASGVLISFIGGSFLIIYRSILNQSKGYVSVLERINAVGMAVQVISNIPDSNIELKSETTADLARQLLQLYAPPPAGSRGSDE